MPTNGQVISNLLEWEFQQVWPRRKSGKVLFRSIRGIEIMYDQRDAAVRRIERCVRAAGFDGKKAEELCENSYF
jgi:hypothetical protein